MNASTQLYDHLASLVQYPDFDFWQRIEESQRVIAAELPEAGELVERFVAHAESQDLAELEEQFTRTFDINPVVTLEVGYHMFGEQYERGTFLVYMRDQLREHGLPESCELPDHLMHVLQLAGRIEEAHAAALSREALRPTLDKMLAALADSDNPYGWILEAIRLVVTTRHPGSPSEMPISGIQHGPASLVRSPECETRDGGCGGCDA